MKRLTFLMIFAVAAISVFAQSKINPLGNILILDYKTVQQQCKLTNTQAPEAPVYEAIILINDVSKKSVLEENGVEITGGIGKIVIGRLPLDKMEMISQLPFVKFISFGEKHELTMDVARKSASVDAVHNGFEYDGKTQSFDGTGVVCGMVDIGLDANHINFRNTDDNTSRIKRAWHISTYEGAPTEYTDETIKDFDTDDKNGSHATHVGGIIGGSFKGTSTYAIADAQGYNEKFNVEGANPYYGIATGADLAFGVGPLWDSSILKHIGNIINYAKSEGKPVVINMSFGRTNGPHDGTDIFSRGLAEYGNEAILCIAAGNDGTNDLSIEKTLTESDTEVKTFLAGNKASSYVDIWSSTSAPIKVSVVIYNKDKGTYTTALTCGGTPAGGTTNTSINPSADYNKYFSGTTSATASINNLNNRYNVHLEFSNVKASNLNSENKYLLGFIVEGKAGATVNIYGNATNTTFTSEGITGWEKGTPDCSIGNDACAKNVIAVGAYTSRNAWPQLSDKKRVWYGYTLNKISPFSSYGKSFNGQQLPHVVAPGSNIVSSVSRHYVSSGSESNMYASARASRKVGSSITSSHYWDLMQGTSMACPFTTGTIGLWLQADPTMKYADVMEIINTTSSRDNIDENNSGNNGPERWGAGKLEALAGIKKILEKKAGFGSVFEDDQDRLIIQQDGSQINAFVAGESRMQLQLVNISGTTAARTDASGDSATIQTSQLPKGVYILVVDGTTGRYTRKVAIR